MSAAAILQVSGLGKRFGGFVALADIELDVARGERLGLIGLDKFQVLERLGRQRAYCRVLLIRGDEGNRHVMVSP